jgi:hypothetical protein
MLPRIRPECIPGGKPRGTALSRAGALAALILGAASLLPALEPASGAAPAVAPAPCAGAPAMHPMARDMLDRMLVAGRNAPDPSRRRVVLDNAAQGIPRAFYGLILDGVPGPAAGSLEYDVAHAVFLRWAWITPDYAAAWAAASPAGTFRNEALAEAAGCWACKRPADAARWARALSPADRSWVFANAAQFMKRASPSTLESWRQAARSDT